MAWWEAVLKNRVLGCLELCRQCAGLGQRAPPCKQVESQSGVSCVH